MGVTSRGFEMTAYEFAGYTLGWAPRNNGGGEDERIILTTTPSVEGKTIREHRGIVTAEAIVGANIFQDFFAGIRDIVGGRSGAYEQELQTAREIALREMGRRRSRRVAPSSSE